MGSLVAAVASYVSVRFLVRYFTSRNLTPFGVYCLIAGVISIIRFLTALSPEPAFKATLHFFQ